MQDRYVGDIGDFSKFGLLRWLVPEGSPLRLGVNWYLTEPSRKEADRGDGKHTDYPHLAQCDRPLHDKLQCIVKAHRRNVGSLELSGMLPADTLYFKDLCSDPKVATPRQRDESRKYWHERAVDDLAPAHLVFLDPDNGFASDGVLRTQAIARKFVLREELQDYSGKSLVVYHHQNRLRKADEEYELQRAAIQMKLGQHHIFAVRWRRVSSRFYFIAAHRDHASVLAVRRNELRKDERWRQHFEFFPHDRT